jgi:hypothetical protein
MSEFLEIAGWVLLSSVKYIVVIIALLAKSDRFWFFNFLIVAFGGSLGVFVFTFLGSIISKFFGKFDFFKVKFKNLKRIVHIKKGYGLIGLAFLTPLILGIPLGSIITTLFEPDKSIVLRFQLISVILWSIFLFGMKALIQWYTN